MAAELLQFLVSGLTVGAVYALVALGFTLIYNASEVVNFAQGEFVMLGGMLTVEEEELVAAVHHRMDALREHRRGAGDRGGDELGDGDAEVRRERTVEDDIGFDLLEHGGAIVASNPVGQPETRGRWNMVRGSAARRS